jgi:excisionase family DNA binding protein
MDKLYTLCEAADYLRLHTQTVRMHIIKKRLFAYRIKTRKKLGDYRIPEAALLCFLSNEQYDPSKPTR